MQVTIEYGLLIRSVGQNRFEVLPLSSDKRVVVDLGTSPESLGLNLGQSIIKYDAETMKCVAEPETEALPLFD